MHTQNKVAAVAAAMFGLAAMQPASATTIWGNSAGSDLSSFDGVGAQLSQFSPTEGNGRGVVQVGNVLYTTVADNNNVYTKDATTGLTTGIAFSVVGASGLQAIAYDGANFWVGDYSGTNQAYKYSPTGTLLSTVALSQSTGHYDGLEYFNGKLIANQFDGGFGGAQHYSVYDTSGTLLITNFIDTTSHGNGTGIAFDGTNFLVSNIFNNAVTVWDGTTGAFVSSISLAGSHGAIEDLSVDYAARVDTGNVPEPASLALLGVGLLGLGAARRRRV